MDAAAASARAPVAPRPPASQRALYWVAGISVTVIAGVQVSLAFVNVSAASDQRDRIEAELGELAVRQAETRAQYERLEILLEDLLLRKSGR